MEDQLNKRLTTALTALLVIAAVFVGCGASDASRSDSSDEGAHKTEHGSDAPALTKAEFLEQGDEICGKNVKVLDVTTRAFLRKNGLRAVEQLSEAQKDELNSTLLPLLRVAVEELGELNPPKNEERQAQEVITGFEEGVAGLEEDPGAGGKFEYVNKRAQAFGFKVCGQRSSGSD